MGIGRYNYGEQPYGAAYLGQGIGEGLSEGGKNFVNAFLAVKQLKNQQKYADIYARQAHAAELASRDHVVQPPNVPGSPNENLPGPTSIPGLQNAPINPASFQPGPADLSSAPAQAKAMLTSMPPQPVAGPAGSPAAPMAARPASLPPPGPAASGPPQAQVLGTATPGMAKATPVSTQAEEDVKWWEAHGIPREDQEKALKMLEDKRGMKDFHTRFQANANQYENDEQSLSHVAAQINAQKAHLSRLEPGSPEHQRAEEQLMQLNTTREYHQNRLAQMRKSIEDMAITGYQDVTDPKTGQVTKQPVYDEHIKPYLDWYFGKTAGVTTPGDRAIIKEQIRKWGETGKANAPKSPAFMPGSGGRSGGSQHRKMSGPPTPADLASAQV